MATRVLITVDTELAWRHFRPGADWREGFALSVEPAGVGLTWQLATLARHKLKACFFVDPMPALVYGAEPIRAMVAPVLAAGQEVQLHLHPFWYGLARGEDPLFELTGYDAAKQRELIALARDLLVEAGAPPPIAYRSGSFAADAGTIAALAALGLRFDSSHDGCEAPWPSALPLPRAQIAPVALGGGVIEVPVTQIEARGRMRHLQLCAVSFDELRAAIEHAAANGHPVVNIVSHSFEFATRDGRRPNPVLKRRFERLCAWLEGRFETAHFADLGDLPLGADARPLRSGPVRTAARMAEQAWSNAVYERAL